MAQKLLNVNEDLLTINESYMESMDTTLQDLILDEQEQIQEEKSKKTSYRKTKCKWVALVMLSLIFLGSNYIYGIPQVLITYFQSSDYFDVNSFQFNALFSVYSFPNIIIPILGGVMIDKFGVRTVIITTTSVIAIGQVVSWLGTYTLNYSILFLGRFIFGLGGSTQITAGNYIFYIWFEDGWISLAYGIQMSFQLIGQGLQQFISPRSAKSSKGITQPFFIGIFVCVISVGFSLVVSYLDYISDKREGKLDIKNEDAAEDRVNFSDVKKLPLTFWCIVGISIFSDGTTWTLYGIQNGILQYTFGISDIDATNYVALHFVLQIFLRPVVGYLADQKGHRGKILMMHTILQIIFGFIIMFWPCVKDSSCITPVIVAYVILAFSSSMMVVFWSCVPLVMSLNLQPTGYGILLSMENLIGIFFPLIAGYIIDMYPDSPRTGYFWGTAFLTLLIFISYLFTIALQITDRKYGNKLRKGAAKQTKEEGKDQDPNKTIMDNLKERTFISGRHYILRKIQNIELKTSLLQESQE